MGYITTEETESIGLGAAKPRRPRGYSVSRRKMTRQTPSRPLTWADFYGQQGIGSVRRKGLGAVSLPLQQLQTRLSAMQNIMAAKRSTTTPTASVTSKGGATVVAATPATTTKKSTPTSTVGRTLAIAVKQPPTPTPVNIPGQSLVVTGPGTEPPPAIEMELEPYAPHPEGWEEEQPSSLKKYLPYAVAAGAGLLIWKFWK